jgi:hypothetical protein
MDSSAVWSSQDPTLSVPSQDDFQQFLDMGINNLGDGLQFDFQDFNSQQPAPEGQLIQHDTTMQEQMPAMTTASTHSALHGGPLPQAQSTNDTLSDLDAQIQYLQQQRHQQQQRQLQEQQRNYYTHNRMIPPTPNSVEMHGNNAQFYSQGDAQQQAMFDRYRMQVKEQQEVSIKAMLFTITF